MSGRAPSDPLFTIEFGSKCSDLINTVWRRVFDHVICMSCIIGKLKLM